MPILVCFCVSYWVTLNGWKQDVYFLSTLYIIACFFLYITANSRSYCVNHSVVYEMRPSPFLGETVLVIKMRTYNDCSVFSFWAYNVRNIPHMCRHMEVCRERKNGWRLTNVNFGHWQLMWTYTEPLIILRVHNYSVDHLYGCNINWFASLTCISAKVCGLSRNNEVLINLQYHRFYKATKKQSLKIYIYICD